MFIILVPLTTESIKLGSVIGAGMRLPMEQLKEELFRTNIILKSQNTKKEQKFIMADQCTSTMTERLMTGS